MLDKPRNCVSNYVTGNFKSDEDRDMTMTVASTKDIAWVRKGRESSGTSKNLARRKMICSMLEFQGICDDKFGVYFTKVERFMFDEWAKL
jgi:hypothetical protein